MHEFTREKQVSFVLLIVFLLNLRSETRHAWRTRRARGTNTHETLHIYPRGEILPSSRQIPPNVLPAKAEMKKELVSRQTSIKLVSPRDEITPRDFAPSWSFPTKIAMQFSMAWRHATGIYTTGVINVDENSRTRQRVDSELIVFRNLTLSLAAGATFILRSRSSRETQSTN